MSEATTGSAAAAGNADDRPLPGLLGRAEAALGWVAMGLNIAGTVLILYLVVLVNADVIGRELFSVPISGVPEMVSLAIVAIVFLQVAQSVRSGRMIRSEMVVQLIPPRTRSALFALYDLAAVALMAVLIGASWPIFARAWARNTFVGAVGDFRAPVWPVKLIIVIGTGVLLAQLVISALRHLRDAFAPAGGAGR